MALRLLLITLCCSVVQTKLLIEQIRKEVDKRGIDHYSLVNPLFGWLLEATGCLQNLRFFSPSLEPAYKGNERNYANDKSPKDPFVRGLITLFPSPAGTLGYATRGNGNFANNFGKLKAKITKLKEEIKELEKSVGLKESMDELERKAKELRESVELKERTVELENRIKELKVGIGLEEDVKLGSKVDELERKTEDLKESMRLKKNTRLKKGTKLKDKVGALEERVKRFKKSTGLEVKLDELEKRIKELKDVIKLRDKTNELDEREKELREIIEFLARLFVSVARGDKKPSLPSKHGKTEEFKNLIEKSCKPLGNILLLQAGSPNSGTKESLKPLLIHAFIINLFDDPKDLGIYLGVISEGVSDKIQDLGLDIFGIVTKIHCASNFFPYSQLNPPPSDNLIPVYKRREDKFDEEKTFSDCVDVMLLNLCNCLFYDNERLQYSVEHLKELPKDAPLREFYERNFELFTITREIRMQWSRVVQDLNDFPRVDNGECKTHMIVYSQAERNEVYTGIINMMNVLARICEMDTGLFGEPDKDELGEKLASFFEYLKAPGSEIEVKTFLLTEHQSDYRKDYVGNVQIKFEYKKTRSSALVLIEQSGRHSELKFVSSQCATKDMVELPQSLLGIPETESPIPIILLKRYMLMAGGKEMPPCENYDDPSSIFNMIFISGLLSSNSEKCTMLDKLYGGALRTKMDGGLDLLERTCKLLVGSVNLEDPGTRQEFSPFFIHDSDLVDQEKVMDHWKSAVISKYKNTAEFWDAILPKKDMMIVDFSGKCIGDDGAELVAKSLGGMDNLSTLNLSNNNIGAAGAKAIAKRLTEMPSLTVLDLGYNEIGSEGAGHIAKHLKDAKNLTHLNLRGNRIGKKVEMYIAKHLEAHKIPFEIRCITTSLYLPILCLGVIVLLYLITSI